jgi:hypothetical protein
LRQPNWIPIQEPSTSPVRGLLQRPALCKLINRPNQLSVGSLKRPFSCCLFFFWSHLFSCQLYFWTVLIILWMVSGRFAKPVGTGPVPTQNRAYKFTSAVNRPVWPVNWYGFCLHGNRCSSGIFNPGFWFACLISVHWSYPCNKQASNTPGRGCQMKRFQYGESKRSLWFGRQHYS